MVNDTPGPCPREERTSSSRQVRSDVDTCPPVDEAVDIAQLAEPASRVLVRHEHGAAVTAGWLLGQLVSGNEGHRLSILDDNTRGGQGGHDAGQGTSAPPRQIARTPRIRPHIGDTTLGSA